MENSSSLDKLPRKKLALITGASSGIGLEYAFLVAEQYEEDIALVARREDRLEHLKREIQKRNPNKTVLVLPYDLSCTENISKLWNEIAATGYDVTLLINNAGFGDFGFFKDLDIENALKMVDLNIKAILDLSAKVVPRMVELNYGNIINVSSMASFQGLPFLATYAASKSFVTSFSLALGQELERYNINVQALCPGPVSTEFGDVAGFKGKVNLTSSLSARQVASKSLDALKVKKSVVIPGYMNYLLAQANRFLPRAFATKLAYYVIRSKAE